MRQKVFRFPENHSYNEEDYIITKVNEQAYKRITHWPWISHNSNLYPWFLLLYGPQYSGKTHLCKIWQKKSNATFIDVAFDTSKPDSLLPYTNLVLDNIDRANSEEYLLHVFNWSHENKKHCLFTSRSFPITYKLADLTSRINSIDSTNISNPDRETIKIVLYKEFAKRSLTTDKKIINYLVDIIPYNFYSVVEAVKNIDQTSLATKQKISISLIKELFLKQ